MNEISVHYLECERTHVFTYKGERLRLAGDDPLLFTCTLNQIPEGMMMLLCYGAFEPDRQLPPTAYVVPWDHGGRAPRISSVDWWWWWTLAPVEDLPTLPRYRNWTTYCWRTSREAESWTS
jgi:hypothetical protein